MLTHNALYALSSPYFINEYCQSSGVLKPAVVSTGNMACH